MKQKLLSMAVALLCAVGSWADGYTDYLNSANGYEEVTTIANMTSSDYYYVLTPAETTSLIVGIGAYEGKPDWASDDSKALRYKSVLTNPITDATNFFILAEEDDGINMRNVGYNNTTYFQTHDNAGYMWVNTGEVSANGWTKLLPAYDSENGYWLFENGKYPMSSENWACGYLGPWNKNVAAGEAIAANRKNVEDDRAGHYKVYRIKRTRYTKDVARNNPDVTSTYLTNPSFESDGKKSASNAALTITGWTESAQPTSYNDTYLSDVTTATNAQYGTLVTPSDGDYYLFYNARWCSSVKVTTLTSNTFSLPMGVYKLSVDYKSKYGTDDGKSQNSNTTLALAVKEGETNVGSITSSGAGHTQGGSSTTYFNTTDWTTLSLDFTLTEAKNLNVILTLNCNGPRRSEFVIDNVRLIYSPLSDSDDYAELSSAIETAESYTNFGFDAGEYAPYNVLPILAAAKGIDQEANNAYSTIRELIESLNAITPNTTEVDAVYNGNFATVTPSANYPLGWQRTNGWGQMRSDISGTYTTAYYNQPGSLKYGNTANYTMPLKENTYYTLKLAYRSHEGNNTNVTVSVLKDTEGLSAKGLNGTTSTSEWTEQTVTFKTGTAGNYILALANSGNTWMTGVSLHRATASEIKPLLLSEITAANATYSSGANVGTGVFQIPVADGTTFNTAINTAQGVYDHASATADDVANAIASLKAAEESYVNATLNAPATGKRYNILMATSGHANEGKAVVVSQGTSDSHNPTGYLMGTTALPAAYLNQAFIFTSAEDAEHPNRYYLSIERPEGIVYITNGTSNGSDRGDDWGLSQIQGNTDSSKKLAFDIVATNVANVFHIVNTANGNKVAAQDGGSLYTDNSNPAFSVTEATPASVSVNLAAGKYGTRIFPFVPTLPSEVKAYSCAEVDGTKLTLEEIATPEANKPYIIYSEDGYSGDPLTGYGTASATSYTEGLLTGQYAEAEITTGYVLQTIGGKQAFYAVNSEDPITVPAYRAYLTTGGGAVKAFFFDDTATGVNSMDKEQLIMENTEIYNLAGQRLNKAQKGVNIINGKKVLMK